MARKCFIYDLAMHLGRVGVWQGGYGPSAAGDRAMITELETLGFAAFWFGEAPGGKEAFTRAATLLAASSTIVIGTGIASIWGRDPLNTSSAIRTIGEAFPGRFIAGLGVSHRPAVEARGETYERPFTAMRSHLEGMAVANHQSPPPGEHVPVVLAALGLAARSPGWPGTIGSVRPALARRAAGCSTIRSVDA